MIPWKALFLFSPCKTSHSILYWISRSERASLPGHRDSQLRSIFKLPRAVPAQWNNVHRLDSQSCYKLLHDILNSLHFIWKKSSKFRLYIHCTSIVHHFYPNIKLNNLMISWFPTSLQCSVSVRRFQGESLRFWQRQRRSRGRWKALRAWTSGTGKIHLRMTHQSWCIIISSKWMWMWLTNTGCPKNSNGELLVGKTWDFRALNFETCACQYQEWLHKTAESLEH